MQILFFMLMYCYIILLVIYLIQLLTFATASLQMFQVCGVMVYGQWFGDGIKVIWIQHLVLEEIPSIIHY